MHDEAGERIRGEREINEAEAGIVRRIFREFAAGASPRAIARRLNDEGIPGAKGRLWSDSVLRGHAKRGRCTPRSTATSAPSSNGPGAERGRERPTPRSAECRSRW